MKEFHGEYKGEALVTVNSTNTAAAVGSKIDLTHDQASSMGTTVSAVAKLEEVDGRRLVFSVSAKDNDGNVIGKGTIERFVVLADKFMKKVNG